MRQGSGPAPVGPGSHPTTTTTAPHDEDGSDADDIDETMNDLQRLLALSEELEAARIDLAALQDENRSLHATAAALEALDHNAAYLSSLLVLASFQHCVTHSTLPNSNTVEAAAAGIYDLALSGGQPPDHMYDIFVRLAPAAFMRIDNASRGRLLQHLMSWKLETSAEVRGTLQQRTINALQARERGRHYLSLAFPEAMLHIWREGAPDGPAHVAARRGKQAQALAALMIIPEQLELLRVAWLEYCAGVEALDREAAMAVVLAEVATTGASDERGTLRIRVHMAEGTASSVARVRNVNARRVALYGRLAHRVTQALTWVQAAYLPIIMAPYSPEYTEFCREVVKRAGAE